MSDEPLQMMVRVDTLDAIEMALNEAMSPMVEFDAADSTEELCRKAIRSMQKEIEVARRLVFEIKAGTAAQEAERC